MGLNYRKLITIFLLLLSPPEKSQGNNSLTGFLPSPSDISTPCIYLFVLQRNSSIDPPWNAILGTHNYLIGFHSHAIQGSCSFRTAIIRTELNAGPEQRGISNELYIIFQQFSVLPESSSRSLCIAPARIIYMFFFHIQKTIKS